MCVGLQWCLLQTHLPVQVRVFTQRPKSKRNQARLIEGRLCAQRGGGLKWRYLIWVSRTFYPFFISTTSEVRAVRGPAKALTEIPPPLLSSAHAHTGSVKLCKKAIQQIWPSQHKRDGLFWHFPCIAFFLCPFHPLSMWVRPRDKPLNKYQVIKLHQPFVIRVFCLIPNCSWIFLMLSW